MPLLKMPCTFLTHLLLALILKKKETKEIILSGFKEETGSTGCRVFKQGVQNWKDFCLKISIPKGNYWILRIGVMGRCQKMPNFDFRSQFSTSKIIRIILIIFFSLKIINLESYILFLTFLKVKLRHILTTPHYTNSQNSIISFGYVDF